MQELTDFGLATAVQDNLFALFRAMAGALPAGELQEGDGLSRHHTFPTNPMFKGVWAASLQEDAVDAAIAETIAWFQARNAPYFFWWTGPGTRPENLGARLQAHGLIDMAEQMEQLAAGIRQTALGAPGMVADLHQMHEEALQQTPRGFALEEVGDTAGLLAFKQVFVDSYKIPAWAGQAWVDATQTLGIGRTPWRIFVGYLAGRPVATTMQFNGAGVASVYGVATLPEARGQGIGAAITLAPLLLARNQGYRYGVLFATEMGIRVYERIGFRLTNVRINRYLWRNPEV